MARSRLSIAKREIENYFDSQSNWVLSARELAETLGANRIAWRLPSSLTATEFTQYLCGTSHLTERRLKPTEERYEKVITRYTWRDASVLELGYRLMSSAYLSHGSAVLIHGLNDELPKTVYVNKEQSPKKRPTGELRQESVDRAFAQRSSQRRSQLIYAEEGNPYRYMVLSGKNTLRAGVVQQRDPFGRQVDVTSIERTLIDIAVRPAYAGGVDRVIDAYRGARERASIGKIISLLKSIDHVYPYHQCIGFYAQIAGFREAQLSRLRDLATSVDFYLTYGISDPEYVAEWRLFVPRDAQ